MLCHLFRHGNAGLRASILVVILVLGLGPSASAQTPEEPVSDWDDSYFPFAREGVFFGVEALFALENFDTDPLIDNGNSPLDISADDAGGFAIRAGYRIHAVFAAELLFQYWSGFEVKERTSGFDDSFDGWSLMANSKLYPLGGRIQPYAVMGIGALVFTGKEGDDAGFAARMGGGIDFYVSDRFVIDLEMAYMFPTGSIADFQFATFGAGVQYRY
jgi:opacity protein-like surface antigen